ncbi:MAG: ABC transporter permease subunit [Clostridia bacterium]|jgi:NitT/TauT family transport system permease protein|nr:ABC transporter permease subunit [Clostridia bacterium]
MKTKKLNKNMVTNILYPVIFGVIILILCQTQIMHKILGTDVFTLPLPSRIIEIISENIPKIMVNVKATLIVSVGGLIVGSLLGYLLAIIATVFPKGGAGGLSVAAAFNAIPIVVIAPIFNNLTKGISSDASFRSMVAKTLVVTVFCMASMSINAYRGLNELPPFSVDLLKSYAAGNFTIFKKLRLPNSMPYIFIALRVTVPGCIISGVVCEYFAEYVIGVGRQIRENIVTAQYATAWAYIAVACIMGIIMYIILLIAENILLKGRKS